MAIPVIAAILSAVLGRKKNNEDSYNMTIGDAVQPGTKRKYDEATGKYIDAPQYQEAPPIQGGPVDRSQYGGNVQPGQMRVQNTQGAGYVDAGQSQGSGGGGFQNAMGTAQTIGSILGSRKKENQNAPYQMQMRRR